MSNKKKLKFIHGRFVKVMACDNCHIDILPSEKAYGRKGTDEVYCGDCLILLNDRSELLAEDLVIYQPTTKSKRKRLKNKNYK